MKTILPDSYTTDIKTEWLDYNRHMNVTWYTLIFDRAGESFVHSLGLGEEKSKETGISWMALESHVTYDKEVLPGQQVAVKIRIVDYDTKRLHLYFEMHVKGKSGYLAATMEQMLICVDLNKRKAAPFPNKIFRNIAARFQHYSLLPLPERLGHQIGIRRKAD